MSIFSKVGEYFSKEARDGRKAARAERKAANQYGKTAEGINLSGAFQGFGQRITSGINGILQGIELPTLKTDSSFQIPTMLYLAAGGIILALMLKKRK